MRIKKSFFIGMLAMCAIAGCSDNELTGNHEPDVNPDASKDAVYMNVNIQLPVGGRNTRSETNSKPDDDYGTSDAGTEVGKDYENKVKSILLILADKDNKFIACGEQTSLLQTDEKKGTVNTTQKISKSALATHYNADGTLGEGKEKINIYLFCNPTPGLKAIFNGNVPEDWMDKAGTIIESANGTVTEGASVWGGDKHQDGFLMSTATKNSVVKNIPSQLSYWDDYTSESNPFNFSGINNAGDDSKEIDNKGNIKVERAVARFDFKDGSDGKDQTYVLGETEDKATLKVKLTKMALVNMSKNFYYLRRVSADGLSEGAEICGTEYDNGTNANYVVDTDAGVKSGTAKAISTNYPFDTYFNFCLGHNNGANWSIDAEAREQWYTDKISDVIDNNEDNDDSWNSDKKKGDYRIWRYVTENTIPGENQQKNGITTGIVFKGKILATDNAGESLKNAINNAQGTPNTDPILYSYSNILYVTWKEVRTAALTAGENSDFYKVVFGKGNTAKISENVYSNDAESPDYKWNQWHNQNIDNETYLTAFKKAATAAKFTLYQSSKDDDNGNGYYCYYFYWNRHNDNGNNGVMGPMEFAVVRNNVYKLAVTKIDRLGHPRITENDPDPVDPDNPDEKGDVYLTLTVEVLPWTVRINDIEF